MADILEPRAEENCKTARRAARGEPSRFINDIALHHDDDNCLLWPFAHDRNGYGQVNVARKSIMAHRLVCTLAVGPAPTARHEVAHSCGNRGCVNPKHLRWATHVENSADKLEHGTHQRGEKHPRARLTESDVYQIRSLRGKMSQRRIASLHGISHKYVSDIHTGYRWGHLPLNIG